MPKLVTVHIYASEVEAQVAKTALDANNIRSTIMFDDGGGLGSTLSFSNGVRLDVFEKDLEKAHKILDHSK
jgi:hypothetical protein